MIALCCHVRVLGLVALLSVAWLPRLHALEPCFEELPPGWSVKNAYEVSAAQTRAIGEKLGGNIERLTNTFLRVNGREVQVNIVHAASSAAAARLHEAISKLKGHPDYCLRLDRQVIEFTGKNIPLSLVHTVTWGLSFVPKPQHATFRLSARVALVDRADYMASNELSQVIARRRSRRGDPKLMARIREFSKSFAFGSALTVRHADGVDYTFDPKYESVEIDSKRGRATYRFHEPWVEAYVPFVNVTASIRTRESPYSTTDQRQGASLTAATEFWPANDLETVNLAKQIVTGKEGRKEQVCALLEWLTPGKNIRSNGPVTGSRWGVKKVLKQRYGHCWDRSDCFVTFCRALGIPCRQIGGWVYGSEGHVWAEVLTEDRGWWQVDPSSASANGCDVRYIPLYVTEDGEMPILYVQLPSIELIKSE